MQQPFEAPDDSRSKPWRPRRNRAKKLRAIDVGQILVIAKVGLLQNLPQNTRIGRGYGNES